MKEYKKVKKDLKTLVIGKVKAKGVKATRLKRIRDVFKNCSSIHQIPVDLFKFNANISDFSLIPNAWKGL